MQKHWYLQQIDLFQGIPDQEIMSIAKKIIEGNNGEITVASLGPNQGSIFSFTLPVFKNQSVDQKEYAPRDQNVIIFDENIKKKTI